MIYFDIFINFLEAFFYTFFICQYTDIKQKKLYLIIITFIHLTILNISVLINYYDYLLTLSIIIFMIFSIFIFKHYLTFQDVYSVILYNSILIFCGISSTIIVQLSQVFAICFVSTTMHHILICLIAKIFQILCTFLLLKYYKTSYTLDTKSNRSLFIYEITMVLGLTTIAFSLATNHISMKTLYLLLFFLITISIFFQRTLLKMEQIHKDKMQLLYDKKLMDFNKQKYNTITQMKMEMEAIDHRLFYTIYKIDELLHKQEYDKIQNITDHYKNLVLKCKATINTGNDIFDTLYAMKINDLISNSVNINNCIFIQKNEFYNNLIFINTITELLEFYKYCTNLQIHFNENNKYLIVHIIHRGEHVDLERIINFLEEKSQSLNIKYNCQSFDIKGLRILFKIGDMYDKNNDELFNKE